MTISEAGVLTSGVTFTENDDGAVAAVEAFVASGRVEDAIQIVTALNTAKSPSAVQAV